MNLANELVDLLNPCAVIRTTFETCGYFPNDMETRSELFEIIFESKSVICKQLFEMCNRLTPDNVDTRVDTGLTLVDFQKFFIDELMINGIPPRSLNNMMKLDAFEDDGVELYRYRFESETEIKELRQVSPVSFLHEVFYDLLKAFTNEANYVDEQSFKTGVFQKHFAILFTIYASTDPMFYGYH